MSCLGVHFALTSEQASRLMDTPGADDDFLTDFVEEIEEAWDEEWLQQTDKAWDAIHRCLTNGTLEYGGTPLHKCILGWGDLYEGDDYVMNFLSPEEVRDVCEAIATIDENWMRKKYNAIDDETYRKYLSESDFEYTWGWFVELRQFFQRSAEHGRAILFTADQ